MARQHLKHVVVPAFPIDRFSTVLDDERFKALLELRDGARRLLAGRVVWNVNSTMRGGGVAEMLHPLLAYARGAGIDARWVVIRGRPDYFLLTKRIHHRLHGASGDGEPLGDGERALYEEVTHGAAAALARQVHAGDIVVCHDPQTAGMVEPLRRRGAHVVWRSHVGVDEPGELARGAWEFLRPYVEPAELYVFSRDAYAWDWMDRSRVRVIAPSIDVFSPKNEEMPPAAVEAILAVAGISPGEPLPAAATFTRTDGSPGRVERRADIVGGPLPPGSRLVTQVSRWDPLKDPLGVMEGFVQHVAQAVPSARLLLAGPDPGAVSDDPEAADVLARCIAARQALGPELAERIHLASLPMRDTEENAALVNAIQRRSDVVVQKSVAEGFGLTVSEAMWKARPVVASRVGGIQDQVEDGVTGLLVPPRDLAAFGDAVSRLLTDGETAERLGAAARERVRDVYLPGRHLGQYIWVFGELVGGG